MNLIRDIPMDGRQDYDVLGFIYEYLIGMFAANAGKKAGEFYTPHEVALFMAEIVADHLKERKTIEIYDPTSGSGSLLINIGRAVARHLNDPDKIKYYAQELKENTYNLTRMNLVMRGIIPGNIVVRNGDTLERDWPYFDEESPDATYDPLFVDAVVSNPPYSQHWTSANRESDSRYVGFGIAPKSKPIIGSDTNLRATGKIMAHTSIKLRGVTHYHVYSRLVLGNFLHIEKKGSNSPSPYKIRLSCVFT